MLLETRPSLVTYFRMALNRNVMFAFKGFFFYQIEIINLQSKLTHFPSDCNPNWHRHVPNKQIELVNWVKQWSVLLHGRVWPKSSNLLLFCWYWHWASLQPLFRIEFWSHSHRLVSGLHTEFLRIHCKLEKQVVLRKEAFSWLVSINKGNWINSAFSRYKTFEKKHYLAGNCVKKNLCYRMPMESLFLASLPCVYHCPHRPGSLPPTTQTTT